MFSIAHRLDDWIQATWTGTHQQGFWRFVLVKGTIPGACFAVAYLIGKWLDDYALDPVHAAVALAIFTMAGWLLGAIVWRRHEEYYRRLLKRAAKAPE
jgi:hypothetical protein